MKVTLNGESSLHTWASVEDADWPQYAKDRYKQLIADLRQEGFGKVYSANYAPPRPRPWRNEYDRGSETHIVVVSGVTDPLTYLANPDGSLNFPLAGFSPGPYTFVVYAIGNGGWRSGPSAPLDATKPASVLNVRIE